jgi:hypothetical protein
MRRGGYHPIPLLLLVLHLSACHSWVPTAVSPRQLIEAERPGRIRISRGDGTDLVVRDPSIKNDSIAALSEECRLSPNLAARQLCTSTVGTTALVALDEVRTFEVRRLHEARTVLTVISIIITPVVVYVGALLLACSGGHGCGP